MRSRSAFLLGIQHLLGRDHADPRVAQYVFLVPVALDLLSVTAVQHAHLTVDYLAGLGVAVAATVLAAYIAHERVPERWTIAVPTLDILALGLMRAMPESTVGVALVFPAIWLGLQYGRRGVALAVAAALVGSLPTFLMRTPPSVELARMGQVLVLALICSLVVAVTAELWQSKVVEAADAQRMLERAVADSAEQRRFNEAILNSVDVGLLALDAQGRVHSMNPRHQRFMELAYPEGHDGSPEHTGYTFAADGFTELAREELPTWRAVHGETLRDYLIWVGEEPNMRRAFAVSVSPFFTPAGEFDGAVLAYHDVTDLMTAARLKDEFVATVSHELRTPLTSIVGYVDVLLEDVAEIPGDARPFLLTVQRNARRLHRLVDDLLSDALKLGKAELHVGRISLPAVVRTSAVEAEKAARTNGLTFSFEATATPLEVSGDAERLSQVVDNIFNNAIKFTPHGGHVSCTVERDRNEGVIRIRDTGRGIPADELEDVFVKFFRSPGVQTDAIPGTGIGLAISKAIVEAHGGTIDLTSKVGEGTTFEIRLPLVEQRVGHPA
ncbi:sensor histidine kinase [Nocardioides pocheonensis]|uniref:histidine kinase n=1 Tax=Nocardioides pocheonensis TaxID=661485 RepID=A0A3N0GUA7_9ACTN|nr:PAS domain-containing sensor histidine kinase [Nocardioides pocheonensis]RNM15991.1 PAS domain-containing sensor histidine kinase [Nocardioides pocheonensis]